MSLPEHEAKHEERDTEGRCDEIDVELFLYYTDVDAEDRAGECDREDCKSHRNCDSPSPFRSPILRVARVIGSIKFDEITFLGCGCIAIIIGSLLFIL